MGELGLRVEEGQIVVRPIELRATEWRQEPATFEYLDVRNLPGSIDLPAGSLAFTFCQVPVRYRRADTLAIQVVRADGSVVDCPDGRIPVERSASIFQRDGDVARIEVSTPAAI